LSTQPEPRHSPVGAFPTHLLSWRSTHEGTSTADPGKRENDLLRGLYRHGDNKSWQRRGDGSTHRRLRPRTFNAALGEDACVGDGDTTFEEFGAALAEGGDQHWRNNPKQTAVRQGHGLHLVNHGGEFHTFTKVDSFADGAASIAQDIARRLARALMAYRDTG
jgi:hypothetical protein